MNRLLDEPLHKSWKRWCWWNLDWWQTYVSHCCYVTCEQYVYNCILFHTLICECDYCRFATALIAQPVWVMNVIPITEPDTLPIIFDRGLIGTYHDWCEPHSTYPRSYDLMHADHLLSTLTTRWYIHPPLDLFPNWMVPHYCVTKY